jgi:hypothetical protein
MIREVAITLSRGELDEAVTEYLEKLYPEMKLADYKRMWTDIRDAKGETLIDDLKCPEAFSFHFADPLP